MLRHLIVVAELCSFVAGCTTGVGALHELPPPPQDLGLGQGVPPRTSVGTGPDDIWAYLPAAPGPGILLHYDGSAWTTIPVPASAGLSPNAVAIAAGHAGEVWLASPSPDTTAQTQHIAVVAIAADGTLTDHSAVFPVEPLSGATPYYQEVYAGSRSGVVAIVANRLGLAPLVEVFDGATVTDASPTSIDYLREPLVAAAGDLYAVSGSGVSNQLFHFDGQAWSQLPRPATMPNRISVAPDGDTWLFPVIDSSSLAGAGAPDGQILHGQRGSLTPGSIPMTTASVVQWTPEYVVGIGGGKAAIVGRAAEGRDKKLTSRTYDGTTLSGDHDLTGTSDCLNVATCPQSSVVAAQLDDGDLLIDAGASVMPFVLHLYILHRSDL